MSKAFTLVATTFTLNALTTATATVALERKHRGLGG